MLAWTDQRVENRSASRGSASADREGLAAAAGGAGVGVADLERRAHEVLDEVDLGTLHQLERGRVDDEPHALALEQRILLLALIVEAEAILESRAAAAGNGEAQIRRRHVLLHLQLGNALRRILGEDNAPFDGSAALGHGSIVLTW